MTEAEFQSFLAQVDQARQRMKTWPQWMQDAAVARAATFPSVRTSIGDTPAPQSTEGGEASFATDSRCTYLARAAGICNKCGRAHDGKPNPSIPFGSAGGGYATVGVPPSDGGQHG